MESPGGLQIILVYAVLFGGIFLLTRFPRSRATRLLWSEVGPSTRVERMTRGEALGSARGFLIIALASAAIGYGAITLGDRLYGRFDRDQTFSALMFMAALGMMLGLGGALAIGVRGLFRPRSLYRWHEDPLSRAEFLKEYRSADLTREALLVEHPEGEYEVLAVDPVPPGAKLGITPRVFPFGLLRSVGTRVTLEEAERLALEASGHLPAGDPPPGHPLPPTPTPD